MIKEKLYATIEKTFEDVEFFLFLVYGPLCAAYFRKEKNESF